MRFPHQKSLIWVSLFGGASVGRAERRVLEPGREAGVDLVVPASTNGPAGFTVRSDDFTADLVSGGGFPAAGLEVEIADVAGGVVAYFHRTVVIDRGITGDDTDDGGSDLFPGVEFFFGGGVGGCCGWAKFEKPGS